MNGGQLADLREERAMIKYTKLLRNDDQKFVHSAAETEGNGSGKQGKDSGSETVRKGK
jgi:hypothetical protein